MLPPWPPLDLTQEIDLAHYGYQLTVPNIPPVTFLQ
jgi:hypothetical protein